MAVRDRLVAIVLGAGVLLGMLGWRAVGGWLGIAVAIVAVGAACAVYRVDRRPPHGGAPDGGDADEDGEVSTRRRAAGRP